VTSCNPDRLSCERNRLLEGMNLLIFDRINKPTVLGSFLASATKGKLVNLHDDLRETTDVAARHPGVVKEINRLVAEMTGRLGNNAKQGSDRRLPRTLDTSTPLVRAK